jgi:hypothetical protein
VSLAAQEICARFLKKKKISPWQRRRDARDSLLHSRQGGGYLLHSGLCMSIRSIRSAHVSLAAPEICERFLSYMSILIH